MKLRLTIDQESVNIYIDNGEDREPTHIVYWHLDEVEEDANVAISIANAIHLFHTDREELFKSISDTPLLSEKGMLLKCPVCNRHNTREDYDFPDSVRDCDDCGSEWNIDNDIILNAREII